MPNFLSPDIKAKAAGEGAATATTPAGGGSSDTEGVEDSTESEDEATTPAAWGSLNKKKNDRDRELIKILSKKLDITKIILILYLSVKILFRKN